MKKMNFIKITLDIAMATFFVLLYNTKATGMTFHEIVGLGIGVAILVHIILNYKWVKVVSSKLFSSKLPIKTRIGYIINVLLLISVITIIVSGIGISQSGLVNFSFGNQGTLKMLHISVSYFTLLLLGIHLGLHWTWINNICKFSKHIE